MVRVANDPVRSTESVWMRDAPGFAADPFPAGERVDVAVAGAGITGLVTALLLARAGRRVVVLEAREQGGVTTSRSTAKVTRLQGGHLALVRARNTRDVARAYSLGQSAAFSWIAGFAEHAGVEFERRDDWAFASRPQDRARVESQYRAALAVDLPVELRDDAGLPFPTYGAVRLPDQGQLDPVAFAAAVARELRALGGRVVEGARVVGASTRDPAGVRVRTTLGDLGAGRLVLATGTPVLDRGLYFGKLEPSRSYLQAWSVPGARPDGMYLGVGGPGRSIRTAGDLLLTGGHGHPVGRESSPRAVVDELERWTREWWPGAELVAEWSAQDYLPPHGVPFVGWLPRGRGRVFLATGYSKWGLTNGVAAALTLFGDLEGGEHRSSWQRTLRRRMTLPQTVAAGIGMNAAVAAWYARGWAGALARRAPAHAAEGEGRVGREGVTPIGVSRVDGAESRVCAVCPHLGAIVQWNDFEGSWDCPAHGSRFAADGELLEGPATTGLARR